MPAAETLRGGSARGSGAGSGRVWPHKGTGPLGAQNPENPIPCKFRGADATKKISEKF